ncbi:MAG TPA: hypothetical protein VI259_00480 [Gemmatimonadaceae bacterium]
MGSWGTSLYSGDFAADLRRTVAVVARLPFDAERLLDLIIEVEHAAATNSEDEDHAIFWLVVADQLTLRGIHSPRAIDAALAIIDSGRDLEMMARLGMSERDRAKRARQLAELRARLVAPPSEPKPRSVLRRPQPYLFEAGEVLVFPTARGKCVNPYFSDKNRIPGGWQQDGWGAAVIVERGRAFDFLAWYRPLVTTSIERAKPDLDTIMSHRRWRIDWPGTVSRLHVKRMGIERAGLLTVDHAKLHARFPTLPSGRSTAVNDISIANRLRVAEVRPGVTPQRQLDNIVDSLSDLLGSDTI